MELKILETKVYLTSTDSLNDKALFEVLYNLMPKSRQEKIDGYKFDKDKKLSLAVGALLKYALADNGYANEPADMEILEKEDGKPFLLSHTDVEFNLSHSGNMAMCIISSDEVGCDIEQIQSGKLDIAKRYFLREEASQIESRVNEVEKDEAFFRLWTLREAYNKMDGGGLALPFDTVGFDISSEARFIDSLDDGRYSVFEYRDIPGYACSVCVKNPSARKPELNMVKLANIGY